MTSTLPPENWPNRDVSRIIECRPHRWHVQIRGSGPDVLLLHGAGSSTHSWTSLIDLLSPHFRVVAVDLPGHGWTRGPRGRARLTDVAQDIGALCLQEKWAPQLVIGHSAGGAVALELVRQGRIAPRQLVIVNGALESFRGAAGWAFPVLAKVLALNPLTGLLISQGARSKAQVKSILSSAGSELDDISLQRYAHLIGRRAHVDGTLAMMAQWSLDDLNEALPGITTATLFLHGTNDAAVPIRVAERAVDSLPNAKLIRLDGVGHLAQEEVPNRVFDHVLDFIETNAPS